MSLTTLRRFETTCSMVAALRLIDKCATTTIECQRAWGFLYDPYAHYAWWWETVEVAVSTVSQSGEPVTARTVA